MWRRRLRAFHERLTPRSISGRVIGFTLVLFLLGMATLAFFAREILRDGLTQMLGEQQLSTASIVAADINNQLVLRLETLNIAASRVSADVLADPAKALANLESRQTLSNLFNGGTFLTGLDGAMVASLPLSMAAERRTLNMREVDYFKPVLEQGRQVIGPPVMGRRLRMPIFVMAAPVVDGQGRVIGSIGGIVNLGLPGFLDRISEARYGKTGGFMLVDRNSKIVVTASEQKMILRNAATPGLDPLVARFLDGYEGYGVLRDAWNEELLSAAKGVPVANWLVSVTLPVEEAFAPVRRMRMYLIIATLIVSVLGGTATWMVIRRQMRPMRDAARDMTDMTRGARAIAPLPIPPQQELGQVVGSFNQLVEALAGREEALRHSERIARAIVEASPVPFAVIDRDLNITFLNAAFTAATGYTAADLPTMVQWFRLAYPDYAYRQWAMGMIGKMKHHVETTKVPHVPFEQRVACRDGTTRTFLCSGTVLDDYDDSANLVVLYDITERKRTEAELEGYRNHLEDLVAARTEELARANEEAEAARRAQIERMKVEAEAKMESRKLEAVGTLAAGIAHDFNNILGSIIGFAELTADDLADGSVARANVAQIVNAGFRARDLVARMLAFARQQPSEPVPINVVDETTEALALLRASMPPSVALSFRSCLEPSGIVPVIRCDPTQIQQIVMNLCINASHAMNEHGTVEIGLDPARAVPDAPEALKTGICLRVCDSGTGMPPDVLSRIFDPFFTTKAPGKGSGLGLSVVYGIVSSLGGKVDVLSRTEGDTGTEFRIFLPLADPADSDGAEGVAAASTVSPPAGADMAITPPGHGITAAEPANSDRNAGLNAGMRRASG